MSDKHVDDFDGIKEEDNPLPDWWLWTFLLSIIFSAIYFIHYHVATDDSLAKEYSVAMAKVEKLMAEHGPKLSDLEDEFLAASTDEVRLTAIGPLYMERCAACHGAKGEGLIGPNLTDKHWIHGNSVAQIAQVIVEGVLTKGMPAWGQILTEDELISLVGYVKALEGKMQEGRGPEGEVYN